MSFDIFFLPCRFAKVMVEQFDPHTGESRWMLPNDPLTTDQVAAVRRVLEQHRSDASTDQDSYSLGFCDGGNAEVIASNLETGCMVILRGYTRDVGIFLIDLLKAGNWILLPNDAIAIAASREAFISVPEDLEPTVVCETPEQLSGVIAPKFSNWKVYRDQIIDGPK